MYMYIFSAQFCLYYKCFIFLQTKFYVIANYSKAANIMNYFKFIKHNKNVVSRKILIKYKNPGHITIRDFYIMLFAIKGI